MRDIRLVQQENEDDVIAVTSWCDEMYDGIFAPYFKDVRELYKRLQSKSRPITDDELEEILTMLPLNLFSVSESLNKFRTELEVHKMKMKQKKKEYVDSSIELLKHDAQQMHSIASLKTSYFAQRILMLLLVLKVKYHFLENL